MRLPKIPSAQVRSSQFRSTARGSPAAEPQTYSKVTAKSLIFLIKKRSVLCYKMSSNNIILFCN